MSAQTFSSNWKQEKMGASQTLKAGYFVSYRSGLIVVAADTSGDVFAGVVQSQEVKSDASSKYSDSKYGDTDHIAYVDVNKSEGPFLAYVTLTLDGTAYVGDTVYAGAGATPVVTTATDSSNSVEVGIIEIFVKSEQDPTPIEDEYVNSSNWAFIRTKPRGA